jgi:Fic family protein
MGVSQGKWQPGATVSLTWHGMPAEAFVPRPLADFDVVLPEAVVRATERAAASLRRVDDRLRHRFEPLARLLLRAEGVASSHIEGVRAPAELVAVAELDAEVVDATAAWVADNLAVVDASLLHARSVAPLTTDDLHLWHTRLMTHGRLPPDHVGAFRTVQNWVGGPSPREAAFVPPPPEHVDRLMDDLVAFAGTGALDPVTLAAVVHAQFESVHPYVDGNGRLGRVLIGWILVRHGGVAMPPPVSVVMARDTGGYLAGLTRWRHGDAGGWVRWAAEAVTRSADQVVELVASAEALAQGWQAAVSDIRADAAARRLLDVLPRHLVVTAPMVADLLGVSGPAARGAIAALAARGIVEPLTLPPSRPGRPPQWWVAGELVAVISRWSR